MFISFGISKDALNRTSSVIFGDLHEHHIASTRSHRIPQIPHVRPGALGFRLLNLNHSPVQHPFISLRSWKLNSIHQFGQTVAPKFGFPEPALFFSRRPVAMGCASSGGFLVKPSSPASPQRTPRKTPCPPRKTHFVEDTEDTDGCGVSLSPGAKSGGRLPSGIGGVLSVEGQWGLLMST